MNTHRRPRSSSLGLESLEQRHLLAASPYFIAEFSQEPDASWETDLVRVGDRTLFVAGTEESGLELWSSDGTSQGTGLFADINPGPNDAFPNGGRLHVSPDGSVAYFSAEQNGRSQIWKTDGVVLTPVLPSDAKIVQVTDHGAFIVRRSSVPSGFDDEDGVILTYFDDLWYTSTENNQLNYLRSFEFADDESGTYAIGIIDDIAVFDVCDDDDDVCQRWRSDGTRDNTQLLVEGTSSGRSGSFVQNDTLYISQFSITGDIVTFDGSKVATIAPSEGLDGLYIQSVTDNSILLSGGNGVFVTPSLDVEPIEVASEVFSVIGSASTDSHHFFIAREAVGDSPYELWVTDGTVDGTQVLQTFATPHLNPYRMLGAINDSVYYVENDTGVEQVWSSDGTVAGTTPRFELPSTSINIETDVTTINGDLWIQSVDPTSGRQLSLLAASQGAESLESLAGMWPGTLGARVNANSRFESEFVLHLSRHNGGNHQLWLTDGSQNGSRPISPVFSTVTDHFVIDDTIFYATSDDFLGRAPREFWINSGDIETNQLAGDVLPQLNGLSFYEGEVLDSALVFAAGSDDEAAIWSTDGSEAGTQLIADLPSPAIGAFLSEGIVYFRLDSSPPAWWVSDGTSEGTMPVDASEVPEDLQVPEQEFVIGETTVRLKRNDAGFLRWFVERPGEPEFAVRFQEGISFTGAAVQAGDNVYSIGWSQDGDFGGYFIYRIAQLQESFVYLSQYSGLSVAPRFLEHSGETLLAFHDGDHRGSELWAFPLDPELDFDDNRQLGCGDVDVLQSNYPIGGSVDAVGDLQRFDVNFDARLDHGDVLAWQNLAGRNTPGNEGAFLSGDLNFDGVVDAGDLNVVGSNFRESDHTFCGGDLTGDGEVDAADLNEIGKTWRQTSLSVESVPARAPRAALSQLASVLPQAVGIPVPPHPITGPTSQPTSVAVAAAEPFVAADMQAEIIRRQSTIRTLRSRVNVRVVDETFAESTAEDTWLSPLNELLVLRS